MELREIGPNGMDWTDLARDRGQWKALVDTVMNLRVTIFSGRRQSQQYFSNVF
jgi:hypothetical protein